MKTTYLFLCLTLLGGCISSQYYQIHEITSTEVSNTMEYENSEVKITYNFWSELGNSKCLIFNKTDSLIFFHMDLSHFVFNGLAYPYYTNKVTSLGTELSRSNTNYSKFNLNYPVVTMASLYSNTSTFEQRTIIIPPKSAKYISGFNIGQLYTDCSFKKYSDSSSMVFQLDNTPAKFVNLFYYSIGNEYANQKQLSNTFWLTKVTNMNSNKYFKEYYPEKCGVKDFNYSYYPIYRAPNRYYIKYL